MTDEQQGIQPDDEDVEAHRKIDTREASDAEGQDVEGHVRPLVREDPDDDDDVEGHVRPLGGGRG